MSKIEKLMRDMEAEINALRAEVARLTEEREDIYIQTTALRAKLEKAKEALKPFALNAGRYDPRLDADDVWVFERLGNFRQAAATLKEIDT